MLTLWCVFGSPLMLGAELTKLDEWTLSLLKRKDILKLVSSEYVGKRFEKNEEYAVWSCLNEKTGEKYLAFFNFLEEPQNISCTVCDVERFGCGDIGGDRALELWEQKEMVVREGVLTSQVPAHGARLFQLGTVAKYSKRR